MPLIRHEQPQDIEAIHTLNQLAFGGDAEANIVDALRTNCDQLLSLVAVEDEQIIGHILFSPATVETEEGTVTGVGLAPMAVAPEFQRQGFGTKLVEQGLAELCRQGLPFVIVLGHPDYYPRFGFEPAAHFGMRCQWKGVPDEAFMAQILDDKFSGKLSGTAYYREEFSI
jgi:putative acetyltransferase